MTPFNRLMNRIDSWSESTSFLKSQVLTRTAMVIGCVPLEIATIAQKVLQVPWEASRLLVKIPVKLFNVSVDSASLKEWDGELPGPFDLIKTAFKVIGYIIGTALTATLGVLSPNLNFRLHSVLGLVIDEKIISVYYQFESDSRRQREIQRETLQMHIKNIILAQRMRTAQREHFIAQQALHRKIEEALKIENREDSPSSFSTSLVPFGKFDKGHVTPASRVKSGTNHPITSNESSSQLVLRKPDPKPDFTPDFNKIAFMLATQNEDRHGTPTPTSTPLVEKENPKLTPNPTPVDTVKTPSTPTDGPTSPEGNLSFFSRLFRKSPNPTKTA